MTRILFIVAAAAALLGPAAAPGAAALEPRAVLELFTSQACSSCPPADARLAKLARSPDLIALTLPVDYWDYLGWKDTLAQPAFSARQRGYAETRGDRAVYTPQIVVNGAAACVGSNDQQIAESLERAAGLARLPVPVRIAEGTSITVEVGPSGSGVAEPDGPVEVLLLPVARSREVTIRRGENQGRAVSYVNVVRGLIRLGSWTGARARFEVAVQEALLPETDGFVVLVQRMSDSGHPGPILGAARSAGL